MKHNSIYILLGFLFSIWIWTGCPSEKLGYELEGVPSLQFVDKTQREEPGKIITREIDGVCMVDISGGTF